MNPSRALGLLTIAVLGLLPIVAVAAPVQKYGPWQKGKQNYLYRTYQFAPPRGEETVHVVVYYKDDPKHYYYWNPRTRQFWGRGLVDPVYSDCGGVQQYQMLAPEDRKGDLDQIKPTAFPKPTVTPKLASITPGLDLASAKDDARLALPPDKPPPAFLKQRG